MNVRPSVAVTMLRFTLRSGTRHRGAGVPGREGAERRGQPTVDVIDPQQKVALRTISNTLTDLEDMLDGIAHAQGGAPMLPSEGEEGVAMSGEEV